MESSTHLSGGNHTERDHNLEILCKRYELSDDDFGKEVSDEHILEIYLQLENWEKVAVYLDLTLAEILAIQQKASESVRIMRLYMLQEWKSKKKADGTATYQVLLEALVDCECNHNATQMCGKYNGLVTCS